MRFGEKVRDLRKKHSLTQDELAQCLGINKRTIIGWERDGRYPRSIEMLEKMADIFHVPLTYLQPDQSLFIERAAEAYGKKGKIEAQHLAFELTELFASGELTPQDMDGIMYEMHKAYFILNCNCFLWTYIHTCHTTGTFIIFAYRWHHFLLLQFKCLFQKLHSKNTFFF